MNKWKITIIIFLFASTISFYSFAVSNESVVKTKQEEPTLLQFINEIRNGTDESKDIIAKKTIFFTGNNQLEYQKMVLNDAKAKSEHLICVLWTQYIVSLIILLLVIGIVIFGLYLSWKQFSYDISEDREPENHEVMLSLTKLKMKSSYIGLLILIISIVFFYLYLAYVFQLEIK